MATVQVSEAEKVYILHGIRDDLRVDGRGCEDYRHMEVETDVVSNTDGSAKVTLIGKPRPMVANEGYLEFFVDCSANATPEFEGRGGEELGTELSNTLYKVFNNQHSLDLKSLCISPGEHCWVLYVDVLLLQCDGNLYDAISVAIKAALFNTKIPRVHISSVEEGGKEIELSDDPYDCMRLDVENVPCIVTLCKIGHRHVVDATLQDRKVGRGSLDPESICEMIETGKRVGKALHPPLMKLLQQEESLGKKRQKVGFLG
uniref:Ribosomal RNA-processing protein 42 n=1 Tax=Poecilia latipinna TaxID=48699 RepID=A0A3B3VRJ0_9TELE